MDGEVEGRLLGTSPYDNEITVESGKNALRAYERKSLELIPPGPRPRVGTPVVSAPGTSPHRLGERFSSMQ